MLRFRSDWYLKVYSQEAEKAADSRHYGLKSRPVSHTNRNIND